MATKASTLSPRCCGVCGTTKKPRRCVRCKVEFYCSPKHQKKHYPTHKDACRGVADAESNADAEEQALRSMPPNETLPANVFETCVGEFWGRIDTRDYMRARFHIVRALEEIKTRDSVQIQLDHLMDLLRLGRSDNMGVRNLVAARMLRLGKDQDCYAFIKWHQMMEREDSYDWSDLSGRFLDFKNADAFEPVDYLCGGYMVLNSTVQLTLLKIKLLLDLKGLQNSTSAVSKKVPAEILDNIQKNIPLSPIITGKKEILHRRDHAETIEKLTAQVETLYNTVKTTNKHLWPALLNPGKHMSAKPEAYSAGSVEEMQLSLKYNYSSWIETPGAVDVIKELAAKDGTLEPPLIF